MREAANFPSPIVVFPHSILLRRNYSERTLEKVFFTFYNNTVRSIPCQGYQKTNVLHYNAAYYSCPFVVFASLDTVIFTT
jgi:hypothetical protein